MMGIVKFLSMLTPFMLYFNTFYANMVGFVLLVYNTYISLAAASYSSYMSVLYGTFTLHSFVFTSYEYFVNECDAVLPLRRYDKSSHIMY